MRTADIQIGEVYAYRTHNRSDIYRKVRVTALHPGDRYGPGSLPSATTVFLDDPFDFSSTRKRGQEQRVLVREIFPAHLLDR